MFSWISTNTSMSAKRLTTALVMGSLSAVAMASARGRLLLPATSLIRGAPPPWLSRESKGMEPLPASLSSAPSSKRARTCKRPGPSAFRMISGYLGRISAAASRQGDSAQLVDLRLRQQLHDALSSGSSGSVGGLAPSSIERTLRDLVLLRDRAERLALRILDAPIDLNGLFTLLRGADGNLAFDLVGAIGAGR